MRSTLACQWCRAAKVKCHHNGTTPCQACALHPGRDCVLSIPKHVSKRMHGPFKTGKAISSRMSRNLRISDLPVLSTSSQRQPDQINATPTPCRQDIGDSGKSNLTSKEAADGRNPVASISKRLLEEAFNVFIRQFPEFNFFHQPTFLGALDQQSIPTLLWCAILALTARFVPEISAPYGHSSKAERCFATYVRRNIMNYTTTTMDIYACQALVMLCIYDWGEGDGSRAWIYNGMAARIAHGVHARARRLAEKNPSTGHNFQLEEARRTVWACFLVDAMIGCGKCHASDHSLSVRGVSLPQGKDDFAFGNNPISNESFLELSDLESDNYRPTPLVPLCIMGCDRSLALIIQGFSIWHTISAWVAAGGRKRESFASKLPPWDDSSFFARSMAALKDWRASQHPQLSYSPSNMNFRVHITRGEGEHFAMINLVYYLSVIFLYREYLPFTPQIIDRSAEDINTAPPLEGVPIGWQNQGYQDMLAASSNIIMIMQELDQRGIYFQTPFTSFCVFSAATWLLCAAHPVTQDLDVQHSFLLSWAIEWLSRACKVWRVACGWYTTLLTFNQLYNQTVTGTMHQAYAQSDLHSTLEENVQRLAGIETTESDDSQTANILLLLQRQQRRRQSLTGSRATASISNTTRPAQETDNFTSVFAGDFGSEMEAEIPLPTSPFRLDQDLFTTILTDSAGNWFRPDVDLGPVFGE